MFNVKLYITLLFSMHCLSLYTVSHCTLSVILHCQSLYTVSHSALSVTVHCQSLYTVSHSTLSVTVHCQSLYTVSHYTLSVILHCQSLYTVSHSTLSVIVHCQSLSRSHCKAHKKCQPSPEKFPIYTTPLEKDTTAIKKAPTTMKQLQPPPLENISIPLKYLQPRQKKINPLKKP